MYKHFWFLIFLFWGYGTFDAVTPAPAPTPTETITSEVGAVTSFDTLTGPIGGSGSGGGG